MKIVLAYPAHASAVDGIRDYAMRMVEQLRRESCDAELSRPGRGLTLAHGLLRPLPVSRGSTLVVQYNPFSWGRWGVAPNLALALSLVRLLRPRARVLLMVHEGYVPIWDLRSLLMGAWQRAQVRILLSMAHGALASTGVLTSELSRGWPRRPVRHLPVSSNLPDERASRHLARRMAGYEGRLVVATFTSGHPSHLYGHAVHAVEAVAGAVSKPVVLLLLGCNNVPPFEVSSVEQCVAPGYLDERALARTLSTADLFLAPFADGATTRRTTLMAAMQHGVAIVTTASRCTEPILTEGEALAFAATEDAAGFATQAVRLAIDTREREQRALAGRALYERHFSLEAVCADLGAAIAGGCSPRSR